MGLRFRKTKNFGPFRVTMSKSGISTSVGVKGFRVTKTASGRVRATASIPGTGIGYVKEYSKKPRAVADAPVRANFSQTRVTWPMGIRYKGDLPPISDKYDDLTEDAARFVIARGYASISEVQRELRLGYSRAARIIDQLCEVGIVGSFNGNFPREVLIGTETEPEPELPIKELPFPAQEPPTRNRGANHVLKLILIGSAIGLILVMMIELIDSMQARRASQTPSSAIITDAPSHTISEDFDSALTRFDPAVEDAVPASLELNEQEPTLEPDPTPAPVYTYVVNTNTGKFHNPGCSSVSKIKDKNKTVFTGTREDLIAQGYSPCGSCKP